MSRRQGHAILHGNTLPLQHVAGSGSLLASQGTAAVALLTSRWRHTHKILCSPYASCLSGTVETIGTSIATESMTSSDGINKAKKNRGGYTEVLFISRCCCYPFCNRSSPAAAAATLWLPYCSARVCNSCNNVRVDSILSVLLATPTALAAPTLATSRGVTSRKFVFDFRPGRPGRPRFPFAPALRAPAAPVPNAPLIVAGGFDPN